MPMTDKDTKKPITFRIAAWYGFIFSGVFLLYGLVSIVLGILDRNYDSLAEPVLFTLLGLILVAFAFAYVEFKPWGWYGLIVINALIIVAALAGIRHVENVVLLVLSAVALFALLAGPTKQYLSEHR